MIMSDSIERLKGTPEAMILDETAKKIKFQDSW